MTHLDEELASPAGRIHTAGERVPAGRYQRLDSQAVVSLAADDILPASLDGQVATYIRVDDLWAQVDLSHSSVAA